jgi:hypothetical protein
MSKVNNLHIIPIKFFIFHRKLKLTNQIRESLFSDSENIYILIF